MLDFLSADAQGNTAFFRDLVQSLLSHGKVNRAEDVLEFMYSHGDALGALADELVKEYAELSGAAG